MTDLDALLRLAERATPGPWVQISGSHISIDRGERPQVFHAARLPEDIDWMETCDPETIAGLVRELMAWRAAVAAQDADDIARFGRSSSTWELWEQARRLRAENEGRGG